MGSGESVGGTPWSSYTGIAGGVGGSVAVSGAVALSDGAVAGRVGVSGSVAVLGFSGSGLGEWWRRRARTLSFGGEWFGREAGRGRLRSGRWEAGGEGGGVGVSDDVSG